TTVPSWVCWPYSSEARISPVRRVKRSRSTVPPRRCAPSTDISAIAPRLTKMRRRCNVTASPRARGGSVPAAGRSTTSRIRPMVRPSLSSSGRPLSRDVNTWGAVTVCPSPPEYEPASTIIFPPGRRKPLQALARADRGGDGVPRRSQRALPRVVVPAGRVIQEVQVDDQAAVRSAQVGALGGVQRVPAAAVAGPARGAVAQRQQQAA